MYVFIDESGDYGFTRKSTRFIVIACLICENPFVFDSIIKKMRRHHFKKEMASLGEIKAYHSAPEIKTYMIDKLNEIQNAEIVFLVANKWESKTPAIRDNLDAKTLFRVIYSTLKGILREYHFHEMLIDNLSPVKGFLKELKSIFYQEDQDHSKVEIRMANSNSWCGLQFTDLLAWCCFRAFENQDRSYMDRIKLKNEVYTI